MGDWNFLSNGSNGSNDSVPLPFTANEEHSHCDSWRRRRRGGGRYFYTKARKFFARSSNKVTGSSGVNSPNGAWSLCPKIQFITG